MDSPWMTAQLTAAYLLIVYIGPKLMKGGRCVMGAL